MTPLEKRKLLEFIGRLVKYELLSDADVNEILEICSFALDKELRKGRG